MATSAQTGSPTLAASVAPTSAPASRPTSGPSDSPTGWPTSTQAESPLQRRQQRQLQRRRSRKPQRRQSVRPGRQLPHRPSRQPQRRQRCPLNTDRAANARAVRVADGAANSAQIASPAHRAAAAPTSALKNSWPLQRGQCRLPSNRQVSYLRVLRTLRRALRAKGVS